jgi:hypothetical protein
MYVGQIGFVKTILERRIVMKNCKDDLGQVDGEPSPFDPSRFRLSLNELEKVSVKPALTSVAVGRPSNDDFFRSNPSQDYRLVTGILSLSKGTEVYLLSPEVHSQFGEDPTVSVRELVTCITRDRAVTLWPIGIDNGLSNTWNSSAREVVLKAETSWVRVGSDRKRSSYRMDVAEKMQFEPEWPDIPFGGLLEIAFRDMMIVSLDHPVIQRLKGRM